MQRAGLDALDAPSADAGEMRLGRPRLKIPEDLLFSQQAARGSCIVGHEHGRRGLHIAGEPFEHAADLRLTLDREGEATLEPLGADRHQTLLHDIAGVFEVGDEGEDFRQPAVVVVVEEVGIERRQVSLDRPV